MASLGEIEKVQGAKVGSLPRPLSPPLKPTEEALTRENLASRETYRASPTMASQNDLPKISSSMVFEKGTWVASDPLTSASIEH